MSPLFQAAWPLVMPSSSWGTHQILPPLLTGGGLGGALGLRKWKIREVPGLVPLYTLMYTPTCSLLSETQLLGPE